MLGFIQLAIALPGSLNKGGVWGAACLEVAENKGSLAKIPLGFAGSVLVERVFTVVCKLTSSNTANLSNE